MHLGETVIEELKINFYIEGSYLMYPESFYLSYIAPLSYTLNFFYHSCIHTHTHTPQVEKKRLSL